MKSRSCRNFAAVVALVLAVAAVPSHATERRDPLILPGAQQAQKTSHSSHAKASHKKPSARNTHQQNAASTLTDKTSNQAAPTSFEAKDQVAGEVSSGSSKSARTSAGK